MQYQGGKSRIAQSIVRAISATVTDSTIYEPFCGGCNVTYWLLRYGYEVFASDNNFDLILMWNAVIRGNHFENLTPESYAASKDLQFNPYKAFAAFGGSFGGGYYAGFGKRQCRESQPWQETLNFFERFEKASRGRKLLFTWQSYESVPDDVTVYADPPYAGTKPYAGCEPFDHDRFWKWVESRSGHTFVSELVCPLNLPVIWEQEIKSQNASNSPVTKRHAAKRTEKLFYKAAR